MESIVRTVQKPRYHMDLEVAGEQLLAELQQPGNLETLFVNMHLQCYF